MRKEESLEAKLHSGSLLPPGGVPHDLQHRNQLKCFYLSSNKEKVILN